MEKRTIVVACDHAGFDLKKCVVETIQKAGYAVIDVGTNSTESVDFPDYAVAGAEAILSGQADLGVFICGSGVGMSLTANKIPGIYAAVCHDVYSAHQAVEHNQMNALCLGARVIGEGVAVDLVNAFLRAAFNNQPNQIRRIGKIRKIEKSGLEDKNPLQQILAHGQSIWYDNIRRRYIKNGEIQRMIQKGWIRGITSNPSIFNKAISQSSDYDNALMPLSFANWSANKVFNQLSVEDIRSAADLFRNLYIQSKGLDGYVSLEVSPELAHDAKQTVEDAKTLWTSVNRPNLMIKVPATDAGIQAVREMTAAGINVNATLIFSPDRYEMVANAYIAGLHDRKKEGLPIDNVHSVASVFISRLDRMVNAELQKAMETADEDRKAAAQKMMNQTAIAMAQRVYNQFLTIFSGREFEGLKAHGANIQRPLWASTSVKGLAVQEPYYVETLIGKDTVNTVQPLTLEAAAEMKTVRSVLPVPDSVPDELFMGLASLGIKIDPIYQKLEADGVSSFAKDFASMIGNIDSRSKSIQSALGALSEPVLRNFKKIEDDSVIQRIFSKDPTVWTFDTQAFPEIRNRLGWLDAHTTSAKKIDEYAEIYNALKKDGIKRALLLGMGGSSLAPEVISQTFQGVNGLKLSIVDSTDPGQVLASDRANDPAETVYIVSSKSGGTAEVKAALDYFYHRAQESLGKDRAGSHFIAITDPSTGLERTAKELNFRYIVLADPSIGGRFSALTAFGFLPSILMGLDPQAIVRKVSAMAQICSPGSPLARNEGAALGVYMGAAALNGHDKFTIITDSEFSALGSWLEQLIAESSGKLGKGIVPIDLEPELAPNGYANDRAFIYVNYSGEKADFVNKLIAAGHPALVIKVDDFYDLFAEFYRWEIAISVACALLNVNAFDQPNVQDSKTRTVAKINEYQQNGSLNEPAYKWEKDGIKAWFDFDCAELSAAQTPAELLSQFIKSAQKGSDYIAINAYLPRNPAIAEALQAVRKEILRETGCATTLGFGPRFQHSTGQLHKGGANNGVFIQIVADAAEDVDIPNENMSYAILERAQALGDFESLLANDRRAIRINLGGKSPLALLK